MHEGDHGEQAAVELVYRNTAARQPASIMRKGNIAILVAVAACLLFTVVCVLLFQARGFLDRFETKLTAEAGGENRLQAINRQVDALQGKFNGLLAESVETRLKTLEKSVESGKVGPEDLRVFEELKSDLQRLENYAETSGPALFDYAQHEHSRYHRVPDAKQPVGNRDLLDQVLELKSLFYFCFVLLVTSTLFAAGFWLRQHRRSCRIHWIGTHLPMLTAQPSDESTS